MPPHIIIMGMPLPIMAIMRLQHSIIMSVDASSIGVISQTMPVAVILQVILHIIIGIGIAMPGIPPAIGMPIIGIMPFIIIGLMPPIILAIIGIICIAVFIGKSPFAGDEINFVCRHQE